MIALTEVVLFSLITLSNINYNPNNAKEYSANVSSHYECETQIANNNQSYVTYFEPSFDITGHCIYQDPLIHQNQQYILENIFIKFNLEVYELDTQQHVNVIDSVSYELETPFYYQNDYIQDTQLNNLTARFLFNTTSVSIQFNYEGSVVGQQTWSNFNYHLNTGGYTDFTFDGTSFIQNVEKAISSYFYEGYNKGYEVGHQEGYDEGYSDGVSGAMDVNSESFIIFNGILNVAMIPINVFLAIFNFEIFGINVTSLVTALLSVAVLIIVIRLITGKKSE